MRQNDNAGRGRLLLLRDEVSDIKLQLIVDWGFIVVIGCR